MIGQSLVAQHTFDELLHSAVLVPAKLLAACPPTDMLPCCSCPYQIHE